MAPPNDSIASKAMIARNGAATKPKGRNITRKATARRPPVPTADLLVLFLVLVVACAQVASVVPT